LLDEDRVLACPLIIPQQLHMLVCGISVWLDASLSHLTADPQP